jgi:hypothetical protein
VLRHVGAGVAAVVLVAIGLPAIAAGETRNVLVLFEAARLMPLHSARLA